MENNMEIRNLVWRDIVSESGKSIGIFHIKSDVSELKISYSIMNYSPRGDKYYFVYDNDDTTTECDSVEDAKKMAQNHFKYTVMNTFFTNS